MLSSLFALPFSILVSRAAVSLTNLIVLVHTINIILGSALSRIILIPDLAFFDFVLL